MALSQEFIRLPRERNTPSHLDSRAEDAYASARGLLVKPFYLSLLFWRYNRDVKCTKQVKLLLEHLSDALASYLFYFFFERRGNHAPKYSTIGFYSSSLGLVAFLPTAPATNALRMSLSKSFATFLFSRK